MPFRYNIGTSSRANKDTADFKLGISSAGGPYGISEQTLFFHSLVLGRTGTGKSNLLRNLIDSGLKSQNSNIILIDFHGQLARKAIELNKTKSLLYLGPESGEDSKSVKLNLLRGASESPISLYLIQDIFSSESSLSGGTWGPRLQLIFTSVLREIVSQDENSTLLTFLETIISKSRMKDLLLGARDETKKVISNLIFNWHSWLEYSASSINKLFPIVTDPLINKLSCSSNESVSLIDNINQGNTLLVIDVSKSVISAAQGRILSSLLLNRIWSDVLRSGGVEKTLIVIDEAQNLNSSVLSEILSEGRKFNIFLTLASQFISQYSKELKESLISNAGSVYSFNISESDANIVCSLITDPFMNRSAKKSILLGVPHNSTHIDLMDKTGIKVSSFMPNLIPMDYDLKIVRRRINESIEKFGTQENKEIIQPIRVNQEHLYLATFLDRYLRARGIFPEVEKKLNTIRPDLFFFYKNIPFVCEIEVSDLKNIRRVIEKVINYKEYELIFLTPRDMSSPLRDMISDVGKNQSFLNSDTNGVLGESALIGIKKILIIEERSGILFARVDRKLIRFSTQKLGKVHTFDA